MTYTMYYTALLPYYQAEIGLFMVVFEAKLVVPASIFSALCSLYGSRVLPLGAVAHSAGGFLSKELMVAVHGARQCQ